MPTPRGKDNYVGIEIECYGRLDRNQLRAKLLEDKKLHGKFDVTYDYSIRPSALPIPEGALRLKAAPLVNIYRKFKPSSFSYYDSSSRVRQLVERKGKSGLYEKCRVEPYYYEEKWNGTKWVRVRGIKYKSSKEYLDGTSKRNAHNYDYYLRQKDYFRATSPRCIEVRLLVKQKEAHHIIKRVYDILNANGFATNHSCGLHVHLDMRNRKKEIVYKNLFLCQDLFYTVHKARRRSNWCKKNTGNTYNRQLDNGGRYYCINPLSYNRHRTLEVRVGQATMDADKVIAWVRMLCNIADRKSAFKEPIKTVAQYFKKFTMTDTQIKSIKDMAKRRASSSNGQPVGRPRITTRRYRRRVA